MRHRTKIDNRDKVSCKAWRRCKVCCELLDISEFLIGKCCGKVCILCTKLRHKYGINRSEYNAILDSENGVCIICGKTPEEEGNALAVDHCHNTGDVRGILCRNCNMTLGLVKEDINILKNMIKYLEK